MVAYKRKWPLSEKKLFMKPIRITGFKKIYEGLLADLLVRVLFVVVAVSLVPGAWMGSGGFRSIWDAQLITIVYAVRMLLPLAAQLLVFFGLQEVMPISDWFARCKKWVILAILSTAANFVVVVISISAIDTDYYLGVRLSSVVFILELVFSGLMLVSLARGMWETLYHCGGEERVEQRFLGLERCVLAAWAADIVLSLLFAAACSTIIPQFEDLILSLSHGIGAVRGRWALSAYLVIFSLTELWRFVLRCQMMIQSRRVWKAMDILSR